MATRQNLSPNPSLKNNNTGWGGGSTPTRSTGLSGLPRTTGAHYSVNSYAALPAISAGAGQQWTLSCYFQNNTGSSLGSKVVYFVCKKPGDDFSITTSVALPTGTTRVSITATTLSGTTGLYMLIDSFDASLGSGVEISGALFEQVGTLDTYFDGDTASAVWDGADGNSSSTLTTGGTLNGTVTFNATPTLAAAAFLTQFPAVTFNAAPTLTPAGTRVQAGVAGFSASPALTAAATRVQLPTVTFAAAPILTPAGTRVQLPAVTFAAAPVLTPAAFAQRLAVVTFAVTPVLMVTADAGPVVPYTTATLTVGSTPQATLTLGAVAGSAMTLGAVTPATLTAGGL